MLAVCCCGRGAERSGGMESGIPPPPPDLSAPVLLQCAGCILQVKLYKNPVFEMYFGLNFWCSALTSFGFSALKLPAITWQQTLRVGL